MDESKYTMRAVAGGLGKSKSGNPQICIELAVTQGECTGERITWYGYFGDAAKDIAFRALRTMGWEGDDLTNLAGIDKNEVLVYVKNEEYQGNVTLKVKGIYPLGGLGIANPMSDAEAKAFAASMKGDAIASRTTKPEAGERRKKPAARQPPPDTARLPSEGTYDDDIPF